MRVFLTGASGFLGSHVLRFLGQHEVLCLSRGLRNESYAVEASNVTRVIGNLARYETWLPSLESYSADCCIHLAWEGLPDFSLGRCRQNLDSNLTLVEGLLRAHVKRLVVAGSCWEYGSVNGAIAEDHTPVDCGVFASTKQAFHLLLDSVARDQGIDYRWARIFFVYGPGQRATSLIPVCHAAYSEGAAPQVREPRVARDYIYVEDVARGILALAENDIESGIYNLGSGQPTSVGAVVNQVATYLGEPPAFSDDGFDSGFWADNAKIVSAAAWRPLVSLSAGVAATLDALGRAS
jgi:UDP-glucose 4-epimerase